MNKLQEAYDIFRGAGRFKISYFGRMCCPPFLTIDKSTKP